MSLKAWCLDGAGAGAGGAGGAGAGGVVVLLVVFFCGALLGR